MPTLRSTGGTLPELQAIREKMWQSGRDGPIIDIVTVHSTGRRFQGLKHYSPYADDITCLCRPDPQWDGSFQRPILRVIPTCQQGRNFLCNQMVSEMIAIWGADEVLQGNIFYGEARVLNVQQLTGNLIRTYEIFDAEETVDGLADQALDEARRQTQLARRAVEPQLDEVNERIDGVHQRVDDLEEGVTQQLDNAAHHIFQLRSDVNALLAVRDLDALTRRNNNANGG